MRQRIPAFCALCVSRCGCEAVVEDGRLVAIDPDPSHPTGAAICAKGRASPELVEAPDRLLFPLQRTRPKGDPDPGWRRISWDEALDRTAAEMRRIAAESRPESVAFATTTAAGTAISDAAPWVNRLINAFGSPNNYDPLSADGANINLVIGNEAFDPVSGAAPHRSYQCQIEKISEPAVHADRVHVDSHDQA